MGPNMVMRYSLAYVSASGSLLVSCRLKRDRTTEGLTCILKVEIRYLAGGTLPEVQICFSIPR